MTGVSQQGYLITAMYKQGTVKLTISNGTLVFNGEVYVKPEEATSVQLSFEPGVEYETPTLTEVSLLAFNAMQGADKIICKVISVVPSTTSGPNDLVTADAISGLICDCIGPKLLGVEVFPGI